MVEVVQLPFRASIRAEPVPATLFRDWTTATSMVVRVFVRVRSGASAQLSGAYSGDQCNVLVRTINIQQHVNCHLLWLSKTPFLGSITVQTELLRKYQVKSGDCVESGG